jgi:hypothetical protein
MCSDLVINSTQTEKHDLVKAFRVDLANENLTSTRLIGHIH